MNCLIHKCGPRSEDCRECQRQGCFSEECVQPPKELVKLDAGKAPLDFLPLQWMAPIAWVMRGGAKKYSRNGWSQGQAQDVPRYIAAALRHLGALEEGDELDAESGLPHIAHAACSIVMACGLALKRKVCGFQNPAWVNGKGFWSAEGK